MTFPTPDAEQWQAYRGLQLPAWASSRRTMFDLPAAAIGDGAGEVGVCSVSFDGTASSRAGTREGPAAIREASLVYAAQLGTRDSEPLRNLRTGELLIDRPLSGCDYGDLHLFPSDPRRQAEATAAEALRIALDHRRTLALGGEHSVTFPLFCGVATAARLEREGARLGYIQVDHHFDFGDHSPLHGRHYHGSNARRIAEHPSATPGAIGFLGQGDLTRDAQLRDLRATCAGVRTTADIAASGFARAADEVFTAVLERCDEVYVSIDVDVCDNASLSGTGNVTIGGVSAAQLLELVGVLRRFPVRTLDVVEVSPRYDPSGATASIVARLLYEYLLLHPA